MTISLPYSFPATIRNYSPYIEPRESELQNEHLITRSDDFIGKQELRFVHFAVKGYGPFELYSNEIIVTWASFRLFMYCRRLFSWLQEWRDELGSPNEEISCRNPPIQTCLLLLHLHNVTSTSGSPDSYLMPAAQVLRSFKFRPVRQYPIMLVKASSSSVYDPHQQAVQQAISELRSNIRLPTLESEDAVMTKAILAVLNLSFFIFLLKIPSAKPQSYRRAEFQSHKSMEYLASLKAQIMELDRQNQSLKLICRVMLPEKQWHSNDLMSTESNTPITELGSVNHVNVRFRIEGNNCDEATFREAVRRILADLAR
ncbi:hypothetical protein F3Y22_tig00010495pilonHSYRG00016 [Hibiscus syriacus]|uniref:DUF7049 domain-containing protein n=1 Tax=Hibiscus syriacus TaxID=106335 RepID=A0A6A3CBJ6_HIBSY|nr:hypothetical protein F3Y22_tig00010495pilonHSYRG00016 [Hibiscus syriacus]